MSDKTKKAQKASLKVRDLSPKRNNPKGGVSIDKGMIEDGKKADG
jgi:hypothetical protein